MIAGGKITEFWSVHTLCREIAEAVARLRRLIGAFVIHHMESCLSLCLPVLSADNLGKQFGPRSGPTNCWA